jgi:aminoglycoside 3-N-acetyltransferase I
MEYQIKRITENDFKLMNDLLDCFAEEFNEHETYCSRRPDEKYMCDLLASKSFISLIAEKDQKVIGGLIAYELKKFEQNRSEIYIYDLAVAKAHRRKGVATSLIENLKPIARDLGAWVIFVQADYIDEPAIKLYTKLGTKEEVLHFDVSVSADNKHRA